MHNQSEKKVVEVFKTFFEKIVLPSVRNQPRIMQEWKYLTSIMNQQSLDYSKLDLYMTMLNHEKLSSSGNNRTGQTNSNNLNISSRKQFSDSSTRDFRQQRYDQDSTDSRGYQQNKGIEQQKRKLLAALENFHNSLVTNQQKLDNDLKR